VKWMGDRFLALGTGTGTNPPRIASSKDGLRWTVMKNVNTVFSNSAYCVETDAHALHKIQFPANIVFSGNSYSQDNGVTWKPNTAMSYAAKTVAFNGKQFIFANLTDSSNSYVSESIQGPQTQINIGDLSANVIRWNGEYWLMGGVSNSSLLLKSSDGYNWTTISSAAFGSNFVCKGLVWNGALWVLSGINSSTSATVLAYSADGSQWTSASSTSGGGSGGGPVEWNGSYFLCGRLLDASNTNISISSNGKTWTNSTINAQCGPITGIAWSGKSWVVVTSPSPISISGILYSEDGKNWTAANTTGYLYKDVIWKGTNYVAITSSSGVARYSYDGLNWLDASGTFGNNVSWTKSDEATFRIQQPTIVGGTGTQNTMLYSTDGVVYRGLGKSTFTDSCRTVAWNGDIWVAGGEGANTLAYSYDGINWTGLGNSIFSNGCYKVASNGVVWVAMGSGTNTIATSTDGMNWTGQGTSIFDGSGLGIDWNGSAWFAVGNGSVNTIAVSSNVMATGWTGLGKSVFSNIHCVKWMMGLWFIGADASGNSTIASSSNNGTTWSMIATNTNLSVSCRSIGWNGREAIAAGSGTSKLITSTNGSTWTTVSTSEFTDGYGVEWNGRKWIMATDGTNSVNSGIVNASGINVFGDVVSSGIMTQGYCVGANSGVGAKVFNSRAYLRGGEKLVVYGPEYYDSGLMSDTSISMNMNLPV